MCMNLGNLWEFQQLQNRAVDIPNTENILASIIREYTREQYSYRE